LKNRFGPFAYQISNSEGDKGPSALIASLGFEFLHGEENKGARLERGRKHLHQLNTALLLSSILLVYSAAGILSVVDYKKAVKRDARYFSDQLNSLYGGSAASTLMKSNYKIWGRQ